MKTRMDGTLRDWALSLANDATQRACEYMDAVGDALDCEAGLDLTALDAAQKFSATAAALYAIAGAVTDRTN